jgi:hypothetical protein
LSTDTQTAPEALTFADLGLSAKVLSAVTDAGYTVPTPIQAGAIPHALQGKDVLGIAQTGTGKTAAFGLPMLQRLTASEKAKQRARQAARPDPGADPRAGAQIAEEPDQARPQPAGLPRLHRLIGGVGHRPPDRRSCAAAST